MQALKTILPVIVPQHLQTTKHTGLPPVAGEIPTKCPHCGAAKRPIEVPGVGTFAILADDCCNARLFEVVVSRLQTAYHILTSEEDRKDLKSQVAAQRDGLTQEQRDWLNQTLIPQLKQQQEAAAAFRDSHPALRGPATGEVTK